MPGTCSVIIDNTKSLKNHITLQPDKRFILYFFSASDYKTRHIGSNISAFHNSRMEPFYQSISLLRMAKSAARNTMFTHHYLEFDFSHIYPEVQLIDNTILDEAEASRMLPETPETMRAFSVLLRQHIAIRLGAEP